MLTDGPGIILQLIRYHLVQLSLPVSLTAERKHPNHSNHHNFFTFTNLSTSSSPTTTKYTVMSDKEGTPPDKICNLKLSALALTYAESMKTIDQLADGIDEAANVTETDDAENIAEPYDENEGYSSRLEMLADKLIKGYVEGGKPSEEVPELVFSIPCINPAHTVTNNLAEGYFIIRGSSLEKLSVAQAIKWADDNLSKANCGHTGCTITLDDCLQECIEGEILCYKCKGDVLVDARMACSDHPETKLEYLVIVALLHVSNWYNFSAKKKMLRNVTLPFTEIPTMPGSQIFLCTVLQGLGLHPWVKTKSRNILCHLLKAPRLTEFASLVSLLTDFDKAGEQSVTGSAQVGPLGSVEKRLLEDQKLQNRKKELAHLNGKLMTNKRKREELSCNFANFKKRKLNEVGNRQFFETGRSTFIDDKKCGGLNGGFSDISIHQSIYTANLHANVGPKWKAEGEDDKVVTSVTRTWDDQYYCVECRGQKRHNIFNKAYFALVIADQHFPSMVPAMDGVCICVIRHQDLSAAQLLTHTIWMLADAAECDVKPRSPDEHGACSVLQLAYEKGKDIHIFIASGTGLVSDQAAGTSYQMQRGLRLISNDKLGKGKSNLFKRLIFLQPAIPSILYPTEDTCTKEKLAMMEIEMSNAARLLSLNSSSGNFQLKTFLSATETVMVDELGEDKDDLRKWSSFQCVTKLKNWSTSTQVGEMQKCHLSRWPAWPMKGRSDGNALTLDFLAKYSAAVMVDMLHSLSIEENNKLGTRNVVRTTPKVGEMVTLRASVQNMVMSIQTWNREANSKGTADEYGCYNVVRHRDPKKFDSITIWRAHCVECYGHDKGAEGRRK